MTNPEKKTRAEELGLWNNAGPRSGPRNPDYPECYLDNKRKQMLVPPKPSGLISDNYSRPETALELKQRITIDDPKRKKYWAGKYPKAGKTKGLADTPSAKSPVGDYSHANNPAFKTTPVDRSKKRVSTLGTRNRLNHRNDILPAPLAAILEKDWNKK